MSNNDSLEETPPDDPNLRQLREKADRAATLESENAELRKQVAINNAGLAGLTARQMRALAREDDIDWEDPESIRTAATELGYSKPAETPPDPDASPEELAGHERVANAGAGAENPPWDPKAEIDKLDPNLPEAEFDRQLAAITAKAKDPMRL